MVQFSEPFFKGFDGVRSVSFQDDDLHVVVFQKIFDVKKKFKSRDLKIMTFKN